VIIRIINPNWKKDEKKEGLFFKIYAVSKQDLLTADELP